MRGRAAAVFCLLLLVAGLMMVWTWTGHTAFAAAGTTLVVIIVAVCLSGGSRERLELVGGPLDGARVPSSGLPPREGDLILDTHDGGRARYAAGGSGQFVYRGQVGNG